MSARLRRLAAGLTLALLAATVVLQVVHRREATDVEARAAALATVRQQLAELFTYEHATLETDLAHATELTTGAFRADYQRLLTQQVLPTARRKQVDNLAEVTAAGLIDGDRDRVRVLAFLTQSTTTRGTAPKVAASRVEVTLVPVDGEWLVAGLQPV